MSFFHKPPGIPVVAVSTLALLLAVTDFTSVTASAAQVTEPPAVASTPNANATVIFQEFEHSPALVVHGKPPRRRASPGDTVRYLESGGGAPPPVVGGELGEPVHPLGEQKTAVIMVNFSDTAGSTPFSVEETQQAVFGTVNDFMMEASYGQTWLTGSVYGWFTLPIASTCNTVDIGNAADEAAMATGVDLSVYNRFVYVFKGSATCSWNGSADLWVYPSRAWIRGNIVPQIIAHELGHNIGLEHSYQLECGDKVIDAVSSECRYVRDDKFDTMGSANDPGHFNTFQKDRLGWLRPGEVETVTEDGTYLLSPMELADTSHPKALKIQRSVEPDGSGSTWYYLEYRQALGFDSFIADNDNVVNGVLVRTGEDFDANSSLLLDMTPASSVLVSQDRSDPALVVGASYTDPATGMSLTTEWADGSAAAVRVTLGGGTTACTPVAPQLTLAATDPTPLPAGSTRDYTLTLANNDTPGCAAASFDLFTDVPSGWQFALGENTLNLAPGASGTTQVIVSASATAAAGTYAVVANAQRGSDPGASASAEYVIESGTTGPVNADPVAVDDAATLFEKQPVVIDVMANDYDPDGDALYLQYTAQGSRGSVSLNADGTVTYAPGKRFKSSDSFSYTISDGESVASGNVLVTLQADSDGGKGGGKGGGKPKR